MASKFIISVFFAFYLFSITVHAHGRLLLMEKNETSLKLKAVSRATSSLITNFNDATGLLSIILLYPKLEEANGDPCVTPVWSWIQCNSNYRVTAMYLRGKLKNQPASGLFPDFSTMTALQTIDLSENDLVGTIPFFLGTFPYLQNLNLNDNLLSGVVPDSLACNIDLELSVDDNPSLLQSSKCPLKTSSNTRSSSSSSNNDELYTSSSSEKKKKNTLPIILGIAVPIFVLFWVGVGVFAMFRHKARAQAAIAEASKPGNNIPMEERPMSSAAADHNNMMSPN